MLARLLARNPVSVLFAKYERSSRPGTILLYLATIGINARLKRLVLSRDDLSYLDLLLSSTNSGNRINCPLLSFRFVFVDHYQALNTTMAIIEIYLAPISIIFGEQTIHFLYAGSTRYSACW